MNECRLGDTSPEAERVQIALVRRMTAGQRVALVRSLTRLAVGLSRRAIRRAHPGWSEREVEIEFVRLHYGEDLARGLAERLVRG